MSKWGQLLPLFKSLSDTTAASLDGSSMFRVTFGGECPCDASCARWLW
jgi:hypothetical protein